MTTSAPAFGDPLTDEASSSLSVIDLLARVAVLEEMLAAALDVAHNANVKHDALEERYHRALRELRALRGSLVPGNSEPRTYITKHGTEAAA